MAKVDIKIENIGGLNSFTGKIETGKVNKVEGASASGKSSLISGINLAVTGNRGDYVAEFNRMHKSTLMEGQSLAKVELGIDGGTSVSLADSGLIRSNKPPMPKAIFTTLLSALPPSKLHRSIFDPDAFEDNDGDENNFTWIVDELSEAGQFQTWSSVLHSFNEELKTARLELEEWKKGRVENSAKRKSIQEKIDEINKKGSARNAASSVELAGLNKKKDTVNAIFKQRTTALNESSIKVEEIMAKVGQDVRRKEAAEASLKIAKRRLDEAEDLLGNPPLEPDISKLDETVVNARIEFEKSAGSLEDPAVDKVIKVYTSNPGAASTKELSDALDELIVASGNSEQVMAAKAKFDAAKRERDRVVNGYLEKQRKHGMAQQQADAAKAEIGSAQNIISVSENKIKKDGTSLPKLEIQAADDKRQFEAAKKERESLMAKIRKLDDSPEAKAEEEEIRKHETELIRIPNTTTFPVRFVSLGMMQGQTRDLVEDEAEALLNPNELSANQTFVRNNLNESPANIRSLLIDDLDKGATGWLASTTTWVAEEVERQRSETRRIFNSQGSELFAKLKFSPITSVALDTDYELQITWQSRPKTGLAGSGGERMIIAASLLIAMHKAYTPNIPVLMFDGILENLDLKPRKELLSFLSEYAAKEDIAIIVSLFDSNIDKVKISQM